MVRCTAFDWSARYLSLYNTKRIKVQCFRIENPALQIILFVVYEETLGRERGTRVRYKIVHRSGWQPHVYTVNFDHSRQQQCGREKSKVRTRMVNVLHGKCNGHCISSNSFCCNVCGRKCETTRVLPTALGKCGRISEFFTVRSWGNVRVTIRSISKRVLQCSVFHNWVVYYIFINFRFHKSRCEKKCYIHHTCGAIICVNNNITRKYIDSNLRASTSACASLRGTEHYKILFTQNYTLNRNHYFYFLNFL